MGVNSGDDMVMETGTDGRRVTAISGLCLSLFASYFTVYNWLSCRMDESDALGVKTIINMM